MRNNSIKHTLRLLVLISISFFFTTIVPSPANADDYTGCCITDTSNQNHPSVCQKSKKQSECSAYYFVFNDNDCTGSLSSPYCSEGDKGCCIKDKSKNESSNCVQNTTNGSCLDGGYTNQTFVSGDTNCSSSNLFCGGSASSSSSSSSTAAAASSSSSTSSSGTSSSSSTTSSSSSSSSSTGTTTSSSSSTSTTTSNSTASFANPLGTSDASTFFSSVLSYLKSVVGALAVLFIVLGGILYVIGGTTNQKNLIDMAKGSITAAIMGLAIIGIAPSFLKEIKSIIGSSSITDFSNISSPTTIATNAVSSLLSIIGMLAIIGLVMSGAFYIFALGGRSTETAKNMMKYSIIGIIIAGSAVIIVRQISNFF